MENMDSFGPNSKYSKFIVVLMVVITTLLAAIISFFVFGMAGFTQPYDIRYQSSDNFEQIEIYSYNTTTKNPVCGLNVSIMEHGIERTLIGPKQTDENGLLILPIPDGYEIFDIVADNGFKLTKTVDNRSIFVKIGDYLGPFGSEIICVLLGSILTLMILKGKERL